MDISTTTPPLTSFDTLSPPSPQQYLKMEDLNTTSSPSPSFDNDVEQSQDMMMGTPPPQVIVQSKTAKKRKSWGQTLPEPTTMLPPRKRAKTEDEKEQRRIERIKRNRAAAHNSRERKRQETERYAVALAKAEAELSAYRRLHGPLPASVVLPEVTLRTDIADLGDDHDPRLQIRRTTSSTPVPSPLSMIESHGSPEQPASPTSPADTASDFNTIIKQELSDVPFPANLPPAFQTPEAKSSQLPLDLTQHSAAMLCDLQCQSSQASTTSTSASSNPNNSSNRWWAALFLYLMTQQLQTCSKTMLLGIWSLSPSRMARSMQLSALRLTSRSTTTSTTTQLLQSMAAARSRAATGFSAQQQGALAALQRTSRSDAQRMRAMAAAKGLRLMNQQRKAIQRRGRRDHDVRKDDQNGGV